MSDFRVAHFTAASAFDLSVGFLGPDPALLQEHNISVLANHLYRAGRLVPGIGMSFEPAGGREPSESPGAPQDFAWTLRRR